MYYSQHLQQTMEGEKKNRIFNLSQAGPQVGWGVGKYLILREFHFYGALFFALQYKAVYVTVFLELILYNF